VYAAGGFTPTLAVSPLPSPADLALNECVGEWSALLLFVCKQLLCQKAR
jgi:hypothetical protein